MLASVTVCYYPSS